MLTPSTEMLEGMLRAVATTPSYTGGDQGFLNAFLSGGRGGVSCGFSMVGDLAGRVAGIKPAPRA